MPTMSTRTPAETLRLIVRNMGDVPEDFNDRYSLQELISLAPFVACSVGSPAGVPCTRPAGHKHNARNRETHEGKDYSRW
jgi:hypothetical protein